MSALHHPTKDWARFKKKTTKQNNKKKKHLSDLESQEHKKEEKIENLKPLNFKSLLRASRSDLGPNAKLPSLVLFLIFFLCMVSLIYLFIPKLFLKKGC